jgi:phenylpyruvate tautomerase PptA (4-oxalocrotonate tautomerase family)
MPNLNGSCIEGYAVDCKADLLPRMTDVVVSGSSACKASVRIFLLEVPESHVCVGGATLASVEGSVRDRSLAW